MESFFSRFRNSLALLALLLAQTIVLAVQVRRPVELGATDGHHVRLVRYWFISVVSPVEHVFSSASHSVRNTWAGYLDLRHTRQQNRDLQRQIAQLRILQASIAEDAIQGHRLQGLLAFQQHYVSSTVAAQVIGTSGSETSHILYLDKGSADGLKPDQAVITPDGIVGKLRDVFPHTAQLLLISDLTSGAGVLLESTRIRAILHGTASGRLVINNLTPDSRIKSGDVLLSSGGDQIFPRGLPVGTIESIAPDTDHQPYTLIRVHPAANLTQLEEVLVITGTQPNLALQTQQDLAAGAQASAEARAAAAKAEADRVAAEALAKAEADAAQPAAADQSASANASPSGSPAPAGSQLGSQTASQIISDRLPSLPQAATPAPGQKAADATPGGAVPRPLPVVHPDHYSPNSTPSAADLTPGGRAVTDPVNQAPPAAPHASLSHSASGTASTVSPRVSPGPAYSTPSASMPSASAHPVAGVPTQPAPRAPATASGLRPASAGSSPPAPRPYVDAHWVGKISASVPTQDQKTSATPRKTVKTPSFAPQNSTEIPPSSQPSNQQN